MASTANEPFMQRIYDSEINVTVTVSSFWDCGFRVELGDPMNGVHAATEVRTWQEVERWLRRAILRCYPDSSFAKEERASGAPLPEGEIPGSLPGPGRVGAARPPVQMEWPGQGSVERDLDFSTTGMKASEIFQKIEDTLIRQGFRDFAVKTEDGCFYWRPSPPRRPQRPPDSEGEKVVSLTDRRRSEKAES